MKSKYFLLAMLISCVAYSANAQFITNINAGSPVGVLKDSRNGLKYLTYGADISFVHHANIQGDDKHKQTYLDNFWLSGGASFIKDGQLSKVYVEAGYWLVFNIGVGYTYNSMFESKRNNYHMFLGLPFPVTNPGKKLVVFVEPYTRFKLAGDPGSLNDYGGLVKIFWHFVSVE